MYLPVAYRFPFYYELKLIFLLWLISPVSRGSLGSSILYRNIVHPNILKREEVGSQRDFFKLERRPTFSLSAPQRIDQMITRAQEQSYVAVVRLGRNALEYLTTMAMQTAMSVSVQRNEIFFSNVGHVRFTSHFCTAHAQFARKLQKTLLVVTFVLTHYGSKSTLYFVALL